MWQTPCFNEAFRPKSKQASATIFVKDVSGVGTIADEMKPRKPLKKISDKRLKMLKEANGNIFSLQHNSTIRRKLCNAQSAEQKLLVPTYTQTPTASHSVNLHRFRLNKKHAKTNLSANVGKQRKPVNKQSTKQKARLQKLAATRQRWWDEAQASGKPLNCGICDEEIRMQEELASDHIEPGNGKSDSETNLQPTHGICNVIKGSKRNFKIVCGDRNWRLIHGLL